jgi:5-methylcytosine-specific restriction endonuclease McrA
MKICWDNLEKVRLSKRGNLKKGTAVYIEKSACAKCGDPYLTIKSAQSRFCTISCANSGKNHPLYGKHHTIETIKKISKSNSRRVGALNNNYRGGVKMLGLTTYDTYGSRLDLYERVRKQSGTKILEVKCAYCGQWYAPSFTAVTNRLKAINNLNQGEMRFYCSENCKRACPIYNQRKYPKGFKHTTSREVSPYLRQMVFKRDNWTCQICGKTSKEAQLHCHHMDPVAQNPMFQNDMDSCVTLCKGCHKMVHSRRGCRYVDLQCKTKTAAQHTVKGYGVS